MVEGASAGPDAALEKLRNAVRARHEVGAPLDKNACKEASEFLNEYFAEGLLDIVLSHSEVGGTNKRRMRGQEEAGRRLPPRSPGLSASSPAAAANVPSPSTLA